MTSRDEDTQVEPASESAAPIPSRRPSRSPAFRPSAGMAVGERVRLIEPLASGGMSEIWIAEHTRLGTRVAVKFALSSHDERMCGRLVREGQLAARLDHPHAVKIYDQGELPNGTPYLVMELLEGITLKSHLAEHGPLSVEHAGRLIGQIAEVLSAAHRMNILHRDVKPANIMLLGSTTELFAKLLDFGVAKDASSEGDITLTLDGHMVGTPAYMAPEQLLEGTAANRDSDIWALAVLAYEALAGHRPFRGTTRAAVGVAMMLERHEPVFAARPGLPESLAEFFSRALRVRPEARFHSVDELSAAYADALSGEPATAAPRRHTDLRIPQRLYGRDRELAAALEIYDEARRGRSRLLMIRGFSGIGKTALVRELHRRVGHRGAISVGGKFDPFDRGRPYRSVVQALSALVRVLTSRESALSQVAHRVNEALRGHGQVLVDAVPELEDLIGRQPALPPAPASERKHRLHAAVRAFIGAIATERRPLILFLDDLQWADLPSLELITKLVTAPDARHVLFVGAYRDNEVPKAHPVSQCIAEMRAAGAVDELHLGPIDADAVLELLSDVVGAGRGRLWLAMTCHARSRGNPLFLRRLLDSLHDDGLLAYDTATDAWTWELPEILKRPVEDNVDAFVAMELESMAPDVRRSLSLAACIGDRFDIETLAQLQKQPVAEALQRLKPAITAELVLPTHGMAWLPISSTGTTPDMVFRFAHDRVRQAARERLVDDEAVEIHESIADHLRERLSDDPADDPLFEFVEQLVRGLGEGDRRLRSRSAAWRRQARDLCLRAARRSAQSAAFAAAHRYFSEAERLLEDDVWSREPEVVRALRVDGARAALLAGAPEAMRARIDDARSHGRDALDRAIAQEVEIHARLAERDLAGALELGRALLDALGFFIPADPDEAAVARAIDETMKRVALSSAPELAALPSCDDPRVVVAVRLHTAIATSAYLTAPRVLPLLGCSLVETTLARGVCPDSPYGFALLGMALHADNRLHEADRVATVALSMLGRLDHPAGGPRTRHVVEGHLRVFSRPLVDSVEPLNEIYLAGMEHGDLEYAGWALHLSVANGFYAGENIPALRARHDRHLALLDHHRQRPQRTCTVPFGQLLANLAGEEADPTRLTGELFQADVEFDALVAADFRGAALIVATLRVFLRCLFGDYDGARREADRGMPFLDAAGATYHQVFLHAYRSFAVLASSAPEDLSAAQRDIADSVAQLRRWDAHASVNHRHRIALLEAERARLAGETSARQHYERAVAHADEAGFLHELALAQERLASLLSEAGDPEADRAWRRARQAYAAWGATAKVCTAR